MRMKDRVAVVFGGANGIGQASVLLLADAGADIVIADRDAEMADHVAGVLTGQGKQAIAVPCDVTAESEVRAVIEKAVETFGGIHALVNCVGVNLFDNVETTSSELWERSMAVNLTSVYYSCHYAMPHLKKSGGAIVNISSVQALGPVTNYAAYVTAKGGMISLTRSIAVDFARDGVRANAISPGGVKTNLGANSARYEKEFHDKIPEKQAEPFRPLETFNTDSRLLESLEPEDIGRVVVFLACDDSKGMTGQNLVVDGGTMANVHNRDKT